MQGGEGARCCCCCLLLLLLLLLFVCLQVHVDVLVYVLLL
jgi:hypothetical protein